MVTDKRLPSFPKPGGLYQIKRTIPYWAIYWRVVPLSSVMKVVWDTKEDSHGLKPGGYFFVVDSRENAAVWFAPIGVAVKDPDPKPRKYDVLSVLGPHPITKEMSQVLLILHPGDWCEFLEKVDTEL